MKNILFILCALCFGISVFAQERSPQKTYVLKGVFKTPDSAVIAGLRLEFNYQDQRAIDVTDINGEFDLKLSRGNYKLTIESAISEKFLAFISIREDGLNPAFIEFIVDPEPNFCGASCPKLVTFTKPPYPPAARAVRATGEVVVEVKIDKQGKVTSAKGISGHPLLRGASENAARQSTFEPSENVDERQAKLAFVFLLDWDNRVKKNIKRYSAPYRMEIIAEPPVINY
jgi:TonB family protein